MPSLQKLPSDENLPVPQPMQKGATLGYSPAARIRTPFVWRMSRLRERAVEGASPCTIFGRGMRT